MLILASKVIIDLCPIDFHVTEVSHPGQLEISNPGATCSRSVSFLRNDTACDFMFSTQPEELGLVVQHSCRNALWLAQLRHCTINQIV